MDLFPENGLIPSSRTECCSNPPAYLRDNLPTSWGASAATLPWADPFGWQQGGDASRAIIAHVQYEESPSNRGVWLRVPGLVPDARYRLRWAGPMADEAEDVLREASRSDWDPLPESGPLGPDATITGAALGTIGVRIPRCHPETIRLIEIAQV